MGSPELRRQAVEKAGGIVQADYAFIDSVAADLSEVQAANLRAAGTMRLFKDRVVQTQGAGPPPPPKPPKGAAAYIRIAPAAVVEC